MNIFQRIAARATGKGLYDLYPDLQNRIPVMRIRSDVVDDLGDHTFTGNRPMALYRLSHHRRHGDVSIRFIAGQ